MSLLLNLETGNINELNAMFNDIAYLKQLKIFPTNVIRNKFRCLSYCTLPTHYKFICSIPVSVDMKITHVILHPHRRIPTIIYRASSFRNQYFITYH